VAIEGRSGSATETYRFVLMEPEPRSGSLKDRRVHWLEIDTPGGGAPLGQAIAGRGRGAGRSPSRPRRLLLIGRFDEEHAEVLALLADGESWSSSALALALGTSQRTVHRRSARSRRRARCSRSGAGGPAAGQPRPCPDSRRACYFPRLCRGTRGGRAPPTVGEPGDRRAASSWRTFPVRAAGVKGFCKNPAPLASSQVRSITSSV